MLPAKRREGTRCGTHPGTLRAEADILGASVWQTVASGALAMTLSGTLYGALFQRAANDRRGGWLFGMSFAFVLWSGGAMMLLPLLDDGRALAGDAAIGGLLALLAWGASMGRVFPRVQRRLSASIDETPSPETLGRMPPNGHDLRGDG